MFRKPAFAAISAIAALLGGCLTSEGPLFNASNARAMPLAEGLFSACQYDNPSAEPDCKRADVRRDDTGLYTLQIDEPDEGPTYARFKSIGVRAWAAQLWDGDNDDPFYFLARRIRGDIELMMIQCESLPADFKSRHIKRGDLLVRERTTCVAKSPALVAAAARAWANSDAVRTGPRVVYSLESPMAAPR